MALNYEINRELHKYKILFVYMKQYKINRSNNEHLNKDKEHDDYLKKIDLLLKEKNVDFSLLIIDFSNNECIKKEENIITITLKIN